MGYYKDDRVYRSWSAIVPSDTDPLPLGVNGIYVGGAGNLSLTDQNGTTTVFTAVPVGTTLRVGPLRVNATLTTATLLVALR